MNFDDGPPSRFSRFSALTCVCSPGPHRTPRLTVLTYSLSFVFAVMFFHKVMVSFVFCFGLYYSKSALPSVSVS